MRVVLTLSGVAAPEPILRALKHAASVDVTDNVEDAFAILSDYDCDALVLVSPGDPAALLPVVRRARSGDAKLPILIYGVAASSDRVAFFEAGVDEVVPADCDAAELIARLHAIVRRSKGHSSPCVRIGNLCLDVSGACVRVGTGKLTLTRKEFRMLEMLVMSAGACISRGKILDGLYFGGEERDEGIIGVYLCMLRKKLREAGAEVEIETFRGIGYTLRARTPQEAGVAVLTKRSAGKAVRLLINSVLPDCDVGSSAIAAAYQGPGAEFQPSVA